MKAPKIMAPRTLSAPRTPAPKPQHGGPRVPGQRKVANLKSHIGKLKGC